MILLPQFTSWRLQLRSGTRTATLGNDPTATDPVNRTGWYYCQGVGLRNFVKKEMTNKCICKNQLLVNKLGLFLEDCDTARLSKNIRTLILDSLQTNALGEAPYVEDLIFDLGLLFELLDSMGSTKITSD